VQTQAMVEQAAGEVQRRTRAETNNARCWETYCWEADQLWRYI
jgi:hypothetical protein